MDRQNAQDSVLSRRYFFCHAVSFYADLHVHSKYSRATSRDADLEHLALWARRKGITVVGTGDFTHPAWFEEIRAKLVPAEPGLFRLRPEIEREVERRLPASCHGPVRFLLEVEISTIYKKGDRTRKVHHLIYAANLETAGRIREKLATIGNIASDGRPILGLDSRHLLEITLAERAGRLPRSPPTSGPPGSPCSARSRASTRSRSATAISPRTSSRSRPGSPPTRR